MCPDRERQYGMETIKFMCLLIQCKKETPSFANFIAGNANKILTMDNALRPKRKKTNIPN